MLGHLDLMMGLAMCMGKPGKDSSVSGLSSRKAGRAMVRMEDGEKEQLWEERTGRASAQGLFSLKPASVATQKRDASRYLDLHI